MSSSASAGLVPRTTTTAGRLNTITAPQVNDDMEHLQDDIFANENRCKKCGMVMILHHEAGLECPKGCKDDLQSSQIAEPSHLRTETEWLLNDPFHEDSNSPLIDEGYTGERIIGIVKALAKEYLDATDDSLMRAKPDVAAISADAAESCIDVIYRELGKARLWHNEIKTIRATLALNFGPKSKRPILTDKQLADDAADKLMFVVLQKLIQK